MTAADASACRAGIGAGMTLAHARALDPDLLVIEHDREKDREALARLGFMDVAACSRRRAGWALR
ncbi:hypothetical protein [Asaia sp. HN128]|uniref:hypothetical protein n=1 Tax=Asaia sp. HN128 TaxID=3081234 RepID=UPI003017A503